MLNIVYEDKDMLACHKKAGELSQSNRSFEADLVSQVLAYRRAKKEEIYAAVINRLDRPVEGLVLFAKNRQAAARLSAQMQRDTFNKRYYAVVHGRPQEPAGTLVHYLHKDKTASMAVIIPEKELAAHKGDSLKQAVLDYEVIATKDFDRNTLSLVRICLHTGRFHQIRAQFAYIGCPVAGDRKYGGIKAATGSIIGDGKMQEPFPVSGIALCAYSLDIMDRHIEIVPENEIFQRFQA